MTRSGRDHSAMSRPFNANSFAQIASHYASDGLVVQDLDGRILWANPAYCTLMGRELDDIVGQNPLSFCLQGDDQPSDAQIAAFKYIPHEADGPKLSLFRNNHASGRVFWNQISQSFHRLDDGNLVAILVCRDVSAQILKEQQLQRTTEDLTRLAASDPLTGLANRSALAHFLEEHLGDSDGGHIGVLQIDLNKFKALNDHFGHTAGDAMLSHVAEQLRHTIRKTDLAARIGGDEFVVVCRDIQTMAELQIIGATLAQVIRQPLRGPSGTMTIHANVGVALGNCGTCTPEDVLRHADFALQEAKRMGQGAVASYDADLHIRLKKESLLSEELMLAIAHDDLAYFFQPTMSLRTGQISGFETLVRWQHPRLGLIPPDAFLPLAHKLGLMAEIDFGAMRASLSLKQDLNRLGFQDIRVGFNGSAELLRHPEFFARLSAAMTKFHITAGEVVIEVLESVVINEAQKTNPLAQTIKRLADEGFTTLLDDFGTGHAGLAHLAQLAVSGVKIDRSMTSKICECGPDAKIVAMIHDLCRDLGFYVVTEGVETQEDAAALMGMGGQTIQGYWLAKPMPRDEIIPWMEARPDLLQQIDRSAIAPMPHQRYLKANS